MSNHSNRMANTTEELLCRERDIALQIKESQTAIRREKKEMARLRHHRKAVRRKLGDKYQLRRTDMWGIETDLKNCKKEIRSAEKSYKNLLASHIKSANERAKETELQRYIREQRARHDDRYMDLYCPANAEREAKKELDFFLKKLKSLEGRYNKMKKGLK